MTNVHRGYPAPWSSRRETVGLMGTFIVFLLGLPSHSESVLASGRHLLGQLVTLVLVFLGLSTPIVQTPAQAPAVPVHLKAPAPKPIPNSMRLSSDPVLRHYVYVFKGQATLDGQPCPHASVLIRVLSGETTVTKGTVSEADGTYQLEVSIDAMDRAPVDWTMEAYTADFKKVELSGRQIVQREEEQEQAPDKQPIIVTNPVDFVVSLSQ